MWSSPHLPAEYARTAAAQEVLDALPEVSDARNRADVLRAVARHVPDRPVRDRAARDLYELARREDGEVSRLALLTSALELAGEPWRSQLRQEARAAARALGDRTPGIWRALAAVAPHLPGAERDELLDQVFQAARSMRDSEGMLELVPLLPLSAQPLALGQALEVALAQPETAGSRRPRRVTLPPVAHLPRDALHQLWTAALRDLSSNSRPFVLAALGDLVPLPDALGGAAAAAAMREAVLAVTAWWP